MMLARLASNVCPISFASPRWATEPCGQCALSSASAAAFAWASEPIVTGTQAVGVLGGLVMLPAQQGGFPPRNAAQPPEQTGNVRDKFDLVAPDGLIILEEIHFQGLEVGGVFVEDDNVVAVSPCLSALSRLTTLPFSLRGPVLFFALARLAKSVLGSHAFPPCCECDLPADGQLRRHRRASGPTMGPSFSAEPVVLHAEDLRRMLRHGAIPLVVSSDCHT